MNDTLAERQERSVAVGNQTGLNYDWYGQFEITIMGNAV